MALRSCPHELCLAVGTKKTLKHGSMMIQDAFFVGKGGLKGSQAKGNDR